MPSAKGGGMEIYMKIKEVIGKILSYHPDFGENYHGCDEFKSGSPEDECTGIVTAMSATFHVIREAIRLHANLIIVHEPTYYTSADQGGWYEDFSNEVYEEKSRLLNENGIAVWRDHDHMHAHQPDGIFTGVLKYMGWEDRCTVDTSMGHFAHFIVDVDETTLDGLMDQLINTIGLNGARYIGDPAMKVKKIALVGHLYPNSTSSKHKDGSPAEYSVQIIRYFEEQGIDAIIPGETIDWTVLAYARDAMQLRNERCGVVTIGHYNWEELGMRYCKDWLSELLQDSLPVTYVPSEDMYRYKEA